MAKRNFNRSAESAKIVNFDVVGVHYEGQLIGSKVVTMEDGEAATLFTFQPGDDNGDLIKDAVHGFWASALLLDLMSANVKPGNYFRVTYTGDRESPNKKGNQSPLKLYKVEIAS